MFGTVARLRPKPGAEQALLRMSEEWNRERRPQVKGVVGEYLFKSETHPGEYVMVAIFEDRESYRANAADPEQDRWYRRLREGLEADPEWDDGEVVQAF